MTYTYEYPRPAITVDLVVFAMDDDGVWNTLLIRRGKEPHRGSWALPGGFLNMDETGPAGALRELEEETGFKTNSVPQLVGVYDRVDRDPRDRVISLGYMAVVPNLEWCVVGRDDAADAAWHRVWSRPFGLAFDHDEIFEDACRVLSSRLDGEVR